MWGLFFVYIAELFPSNVLTLAFGFISAVGTVGAFCSPFIRLLTANATMFVMSILCIIAFILLKPLRETKGEKSIEEI
jgi:MFS family permease